MELLRAIARGSMVYAEAAATRTEEEHSKSLQILSADPIQSNQADPPNSIPIMNWNSNLFPLPTARKIQQKSEGKTEGRHHSCTNPDGVLKEEKTAKRGWWLILNDTLRRSWWKSRDGHTFKACIELLCRSQLRLLNIPQVFHSHPKLCLWARHSSTSRTVLHLSLSLYNSLSFSLYCNSLSKILNADKGSIPRYP